MNDRIIMLYAFGKLCGQRYASELLVEVFNSFGIKTVQVRTPALNRTGNYWSKLVWLLRTLYGWLFCVFQLPFASNLHLNLGQTIAGFFREGLPYYFLCLRNQKKVRVISLHGSVFMGWKKEDLITRLFLKLVHVSNYVTCLGERQKNHLISLGIYKEKVVVLNNAVKDLSLNDEVPNSNSSKTNVIFLSNLMQTKGYDTFLEAIKLVAEKDNLTMSVKLVGKPLFDKNGTFKNIEDAATWIENKIHCINKSNSVSIEWIHGAYGQEKQQLFNAADIFVFPTRYHVEAQPIVLIEAMAARCAVITTRMGEIKEALGDSAVYVDASNAEQLAVKIEEMTSDHAMRALFSTRARKRYEERFSIEKHNDAWAKIYGIIQTRH